MGLCIHCCCPHTHHLPEDLHPVHDIFRLQGKQGGGMGVGSVSHSLSPAEGQRPAAAVRERRGEGTCEGDSGAAKGTSRWGPRGRSDSSGASAVSHPPAPERRAAEAPPRPWPSGPRSLRPARTCRPEPSRTQEGRVMCAPLAPKSLEAGCVFRISVNP